ncbi:MAG TPA: sigma-70 domain-containing protein [Candidatus Sulfotelmatobacter sp.]|nr:sigma-70 domain-containing protein [Candidatus Sulfotelmatobacter sp.]
MTGTNGALARNVKRVAHLDLPGAGQVYVNGNYCYVGHIPNKARLGTTILDVSDPRHPRTVATITLDDPNSHSHKARVVGDVMIVNHERNNTGIGRKAEQLPALRARLREALGREPTNAELAEKMSLQEADIPKLLEAEQQPYRDGGFKIYDVSKPAEPRLIAYQRTGGIGVHRYDMDAQHAYISTEMPGYVGNILVIYDIRNPERPTEVSRWWMEGQHLAGGETPRWEGRSHRLHHAMRQGDRLWAGMWHAGIRIIDIADVTKPKTIGAYNYHPPFPEPTHTVLHVPFTVGGRDVAVVMDEEDQFYNAAETEARRGRPHASLWVFDVADPAAIAPLSMFQVSELDSPWSRTPGGRFGAHQFQEHMKDTLVYCAWFAGGLRIVDIADPMAPREVGHFIPEPVGGRPSPQSNDVDVDARGLIYLVDRNVGFDILEFQRG